MILNKTKIIEEWQKGSIFYKSPKGHTLEEFAKNQSVDIHVGDWLFFPYSSNSNQSNKITLLKNLSIKYKLHEEELIEMKKGLWLNLSKLKEIQIPQGIFFLCYSEEFIGTTPNSSIHSQFHIRSSTARRGLNHPHSGWGDIGFYNRWCMEFSTSITFNIKADESLAQIIFTQTNDEETNYIVDTGNFQKYSGEELLQKWEIYDILPNEFQA
jgi:deoxycytidine triphosphate deaminase